VGGVAVLEVEILAKIEISQGLYFGKYGNAGLAQSPALH